MIIHFQILQAQEVYGPMPSLNELSPRSIDAGNSQLNLQYESFYNKIEKNLAPDEKEIDWSLRPHKDLTHKLKNNAFNGDLNIKREIKEIRPNQLEGELIIRY